MSNRILGKILQLLTPFIFKFYVPLYHLVTVVTATLLRVPIYYNKGSFTEATDRKILM